MSVSKQDLEKFERFMSVLDNRDIEQCRPGGFVHVDANGEKFYCPLARAAVEHGLEPSAYDLTHYGQHNHLAYRFWVEFDVWARCKGLDNHTAYAKAMEAVRALVSAEEPELVHMS